MTLAAAGCESPRTAPLDQAERDVRAAIESFDRANAQADGERYLAQVTESYLEHVLGGLGITRANVLDDPDRYLGVDLGRDIRSVRVQGDQATVDSTFPAGDRGVASVVVSLVKQKGDWLVDDQHAGSAPDMEGVPRVDIRMQDFEFVLDTSSFVPDVPLVLHAANSGGQPHMFALWRITLDLPPIQLIESTDTPPGDTYVHSPTFIPGEEGEVVVNQGIPPGRYLLVCLLGDVTSPVLTPHYDLGMILDFSVPAPN